MDKMIGNHQQGCFDVKLCLYIVLLRQVGLRSPVQGLHIC